MTLLTEEQLNNLGKEAIVILISSLQDQLVSMQEQLDAANAHLADNNRQIELLTEQIRIMNQRHFGRKSEGGLSGEDGQVSIFDFFNEAEYLIQKDLKELVKAPRLADLFRNCIATPALVASIING